jgi:hypothetical protein
MPDDEKKNVKILNILRTTKDRYQWKTIKDNVVRKHDSWREREMISVSCYISEKYTVLFNLYAIA